MYNPISVENETHKILKDFEIRTDYLITARPKGSQQKKRTCRIVYLAIPDDHRLKLKENKMKDVYLDISIELKKIWNMKWRW